MSLIRQSGYFVKQREDYSAFIPQPLPPIPPLVRDGEMDALLSKADRALGRLDGVCSTLPNPDFFVGMYVRYEAVLSSQIEGTQSTLEDIIDFEAGSPDTPKDVEEVVNYIAAMNHGLRRLRDDEFPLSLRLITEIHEKLLSGVRGAHRNPGEFRRSQNWIGPAGCTLGTASFVPPPVPEMTGALGDLENFMHSGRDLPPLIHCAFVHAQFETIHPFLDGNGRVGRLLITFLLCQQDILRQPLLYLSHYFKIHRAEYYDRLMAVRRSGDWEGWVKFFLSGVATVSLEATETARRILALRESSRQQVTTALRNKTGALSLLELLFDHPAVTVGFVSEKTGVSFSQAGKLCAEFEKLGLVRETTGQKRNRQFRFQGLLDAFQAHDPG
ncbi:MAG: Fic family protein [Luteolibacter sp.]